jgi:hypothetical protein
MAMAMPRPLPSKTFLVGAGVAVSRNIVGRRRVYKHRESFRWRKRGAAIATRRS